METLLSLTTSVIGDHDHDDIDQLDDHDHDDHDELDYLDYIEPRVATCLTFNNQCDGDGDIDYLVDHDDHHCHHHDDQH